MADQTKAQTPVEAKAAAPTAAQAAEVAEAAEAAEAAQAKAEAADAESKAIARAQAEEKANMPRRTGKGKDAVVMFRLLRGKHHYINAAGDSVTARKGDFVPLTSSQLEAVKDRVAMPNSTPLDELEDE